MLVHEHPPKKTKRAFTSEEAYYFANQGGSQFHDSDQETNDESQTIANHFGDIDIQLGDNSIFTSQHLVDLRRTDLSQPSVTSRIISECQDIFARNNHIQSIRIEFPPDVEPLLLRDFAAGFDLPQWALSNLFAQSGKILFAYLRDIHWLTVEREREFPLLSHISGITAVKPLPNGCARCQIRLDLNFDEHCHNAESQEEFAAAVAAEISAAFGGKVSHENVSVGGMSRGSIILFAFIPLMLLAAAGLIGVAWSLRNNWQDSRANSRVQRRRLVRDEDEEEHETFGWDDRIGPDLDEGDAAIVWLNPIKKEHCVGTVLCVETKPEWRVQIGMPREAIKTTVWESMSESASRFGRLFQTSVTPSPNTPGLSDSGLVPQWFSLKDWQEGRVEFGPTSDRILNHSRFHAELFWGDNSVRSRWCSATNARMDSSLIIHRQFRVFV